MTPDEERLAKAFGLALNQVRLRHNLSILELSQRVSGRTYLSDLERGLKLPTLGKIDSIARALNVHPVSLLALTYEQYDQLTSQSLLGMIEDDHKYLKLWTSDSASVLTHTRPSLSEGNTD
ncbi:helix-turn-helix transcriptional regulator [Pseudomonas fulva]|jgi:transcriptional regulator with XRE-family HTH domain|uniref:helix-turn-helix domain-containing protein n=1 Tax=Pseudomonas TaxID=286 RepID=UPI000B3C1A2F|nr:MULTISPECIES: helix-turn-helix transcriptional regulator [Pseudomonas]MBN6789825.1 helix-turn-helix transcriptional regulator [Pseudomonas fulva]MBN6794795.1 helix-turn-helix transcriptional regulator [Pseudomonas fulva]MBN6855386.1 helix-turn-helix transcriptional regulator [Pseudomonas fulva]MBN6872417.1 helix-turn-helix transcriptional regulator [Pseudomonas fulva]MBN6876807.1 helix-turn-helix transcriptional regulator [Pseudomonas fulva]